MLERENHRYIEKLSTENNDVRDVDRADFPTCKNGRSVNYESSRIFEGRCYPEKTEKAGKVKARQKRPPELNY
jgi:hypothetical protein